MVVRNDNFRIAENNFAELITSSITKTSELTAFPFSNATNKFRSKVWKPSGAFEITSSNNKIYIWDGANKTITLTTTIYTTPALMATHIQTQLNASSANWTVAYDSSGETYKFTISNTGGVKLRFSQTTNAAWNDLGYTGSADILATSFVAEEQRNHTSEYCIFDLGHNAEITFFTVISPLDDHFTFSETATLTLKANNIDDDWASPPYTQTLTRYDGGIFEFLDDTSGTDTNYRFWKFEFTDKYNPIGPEGFQIGHIYLGDYITFTTRNIHRGFRKEQIDPSTVSISESGVLYFDEKTKYTTFDSLLVGFVDQDDKDTFETMYQVKGKTTPIYLSLDPTTAITNNIDELTKYVVFINPPRFTHVHTDKFNMELRFQEMI